MNHYGGSAGVTLPHQTPPALYTLRNSNENVMLSTGNETSPKFNEMLSSLHQASPVL